MASNIVPVDTFTTVITVPDDGDAINGTERELTAQALSNRSENNNSRLNDIPFVNSSTVILDLLSGVPEDNSGVATYFVSNESYWKTNTGVATQLVQLVFSITEKLPVGATITTITAYVDGGTLHFPANLPAVKLSRTELSTAAITVLGNADDPSADAAAYSVPHNWSLTGIGHVVLADNNYSIEFSSESGAGSTDNDALYYGLSIGYTVP